jgi:DNA primase large subunit
MKISDYPFTQEAADQVRNVNFSLEFLLDKASFEPVRNRAAERVLGAIKGDIPDKRPDTDAENLIELLSYPLTRLIVSCLHNDALIRRYALAEAKLAQKRMRREREDIIPLAHDLGLNPLNLDEPFKIHFSEYIRAAHPLRSPKWKLVNRDLKAGYLTVTKEELMRLMEELVRNRITISLPVPSDADICRKLDEYIIPLRSEMDKIRSKQNLKLIKIDKEAFPPCIKTLLAQVSEGQNLAHTARFALTSFLLQINMSPDQIVNLFNNSPDFDEERTRYQVEHISGSSGTMYKPPSCSTMMTYGNCSIKDDLCKKISHPLGYYQKRASSEKN